MLAAALQNLGVLISGGSWGDSDTVSSFKA